MKGSSLTPEEERHLQEAFHRGLGEAGLPVKKSISSCCCSGCSCPPGGGDICDGGTYVGYAGGYYGSLSV